MKRTLHIEHTPWEQTEAVYSVGGSDVQKSTVYRSLVKVMTGNSTDRYILDWDDADTTEANIGRLSRNLSLIFEKIEELTK